MSVPLKNTTAILIFANSAGEDQQHKKIYKGAALFNSLTEQTLQSVAKTDLPYFHFTEEQQIGNSFGERFTNAIQTIFDRGYEKIITIGNDTPHLTCFHLLEAKRQMERKNFVLGPSMDGGFYLMGLDKSLFNASTFKNLAWQTSSLNKQLCRLISKNDINIFFLERLLDIDSNYDIEQALRFSAKLSPQIKYLLIQALGLQNSTSKHQNAIFSSHHTHTLHNKGSPVLL